MLDPISNQKDHTKDLRECRQNGRHQIGTLAGINQNGGRIRVRIPGRLQNPHCRRMRWSQQRIDCRANSAVSLAIPTLTKPAFASGGIDG
jgi:hypothetical protein